MKPKMLHSTKSEGMSYTCITPIHWSYMRGCSSVIILV